MDREEWGALKQWDAEKRTHQQQIRVLYAPVHYLRPTYAVFLTTMSFNVPFLSSQKMRAWLANFLGLFQYFEDVGKRLPHDEFQ